MGYIGKTPTPAPLTSSDIAADIINNTHIGDTAISGFDALATAPADTDEFLISDAGVLKRLDASLVGGGGITEADQWRVTATGTGTGVFTSNWERNDTTGFTGIGSAMTQSSGIFSFPSTGIYLVRYYSRGFGSSQQYAGIYMQGGVSGTYTTLADSFDSAGNNTNYYFNNSTESLFDVTNTATHTVRFGVESSGSVAYDGNSAQNVTFVTFMRLGDT